jgi:hypothetical protein
VFRNFVITPDEPEKFVEELQARLPKGEPPDMRPAA